MSRHSVVSDTIIARFLNHNEHCSVWRQYHEKQEVITKELQAQWTELDLLLKNLDPTIEWAHFSARKELFTDPNTPYRDQEHIAYPHQDHEATKALYSGHLTRKKRFTKKYEEVRLF